MKVLYKQVRIYSQTIKNWASGTLAPYSPIKTEAEVTTMDLGMGLEIQGKMAITLAGKEYSVEFKPGEAKPIVKIGA